MAAVVSSNGREPESTRNRSTRRTVHFNSRDPEQGKPGKGIEDGTGPGEGDWRLVLASALELEVPEHAGSHQPFDLKWGMIFRERSS